MTMSTIRNIIAATLALAGFVLACNENENTIAYNLLGVAMLAAGAWLGGAFGRMRFGG